MEEGGYMCEHVWVCLQVPAKGANMGMESSEVVWYCMRYSTV